MKVVVHENNSKYTSKESRAIQAVYDKFGGTRQSAKLCGYSWELLSGWKRQGKVPLKKIAEISAKLDCSPFALNKKELTELVKTIERWEEKKNVRAD